MLSNSFPHLNNSAAQHDALEKIWARVGRREHLPDLADSYWHAGKLGPNTNALDPKRGFWAFPDPRPNYEGKATEESAKAGVKPYKTEWRAKRQLRLADFRGVAMAVHELYFNYCRTHTDYRKALELWCNHYLFDGISGAGSDDQFFIAVPDALKLVSAIPL
ncbi:hypothetical protein ACQ858_13305 [Variovorax ureilyticus]|uniref:hypothetical protein n=1 Tax=Variovorax ureilyticus TaxID=1836198 RepID=UPI003D67E50B